MHYVYDDYFVPKEQTKSYEGNFGAKAYVSEDFGGELEEQSMDLAKKGYIIQLASLGLAVAGTLLTVLALKRG